MADLKTFDDLIFFHTYQRTEAITNFENGWGVHLYRDVRDSEGEWCYSGGLMLNNKWYSGDYVPMAFAKRLTSEGVTEYMRNVQRMTAK